ncbi:MAG: Plastidic atp adp transporter [candidate division TM6 bacterium GW2011_GWE2_42_60]|nr:MAG: Plastidic atp adp transporter [candidate division TM6 bacterium GW2011_GWE2_42_60]HBY05926.1 hypothetical protein [Candidatus Dependentiae bacterium]
MEMPLGSLVGWLWGLAKVGLFALIPLFIVSCFTGHFKRLLVYIYGDFTRNERNKFILYGVLFFFIIGIYWLLRSLKGPTFNAFIGSRHTWVADIVSIAVVFPMIAGYSYLVDLFPRHRLFYAMSVLYSVLFVGLWFLIKNPEFGMAAPLEHRWKFLGWLSYVIIDSFGSLMVVLFYSFMADTTTPAEGKKGFFITTTFAQIGDIVGSLTVAKISRVIGVETLYLLAALVTIICIPLMVRFIIWFIPKEEFIGYKTDIVKKEAPEPGFVEGVRLIFSQPYLMGIFVVVSVFEVVATIFDLQFQVLIADYAQGDASLYAEYTGQFGAYVGALALVSILFGVGNLGRKIGLMFSLMIMPLLMMLNLGIMTISSTLNVAFWVLVLSRGLNYAFGQPAKEQLYIPTSRDAKYKSKAWIDTFGSRFSKASGSGIMGLKYGLGASMILVSGLAFSLCIFWFVAAFYLGRRHKHAIEQDEIVC